MMRAVWYDFDPYDPDSEADEVEGYLLLVDIDDDDEIKSVPQCAASPVTVSYQRPQLLAPPKRRRLAKLLSKLRRRKVR